MAQQEMRLPARGSDRRALIVNPPPEGTRRPAIQRGPADAGDRSAQDLEKTAGIRPDRQTLNR
jgi:hypothetical protein